MTETENETEAKTKTVKRFVDGCAANDTLKPIGVSKDMLQTFFDKDACQATSKERASLFQEVADKTLRATEVVVRPSASTAKKAEELAKQADIRNSFLMSAASKEDDEHSKSAKAADGGATATSAPAEVSPPDALEAELEKLMDEEDQLGVAGGQDGVAPAPAGGKSTAKAKAPPKTSTPKAAAKARQQGTTKEKKCAAAGAKKESGTSSKAKTPSRASNFAGPKNGKQSRGDNFKK